MSKVLLSTGGCLCGRVRYQVSGEPLAARICWCRDCQRLAGHGSANAMYKREQIAIEGEYAQFQKQADSGNTVSRMFCPDCGAQLFAQTSAKPELMVLRIGTLDEPSQVQPSAHIWAASAPAWAGLRDDFERFDSQPS